jgi:RNA polymerase sigma factor (sigma-70 family)
MTRMRTAFLDFYDREWAPVLRFLVRLGASGEDAQDAAQEAFIDLWILMKKPGEWEEIREPRAWIRTVARRKYTRSGNWRRAPGTVPVAVVPDRPRTDLDHGELSAQAQCVRSVLQGLDDDCRVVMAFLLDGFSQIAISRHLGISDQRADLSDLALAPGRMDVLDDVLWDQRTVWPPGLVAEVRARSEEVRPGLTADPPLHPADQPGQHHGRRTRRHSLRHAPRSRPDPACRSRRSQPPARTKLG